MYVLATYESADAEDSRVDRVAAGVDTAAGDKPQKIILAQCSKDTCAEGEQGHGTKSVLPLEMPMLSCYLVI